MKTFNICDYGAHFCDKPQTEAIQKAIDDCYLAGGGRVVVPCGIYMTGSIRIRSNVTLYLEAGAILKGTQNPEDYFGYLSDTLEPVEIEEISNTDKTKCRSAVATSRWSNGLIRAFDAKNIGVIGEKGSYIDGSNCFDPEGEEHYRGPHGMSIWRCDGIRLEGYTFLNSANWCHAIFKSQNITVRDIEVYGGHDGLDLRTCDNVLVENCEFEVGDDSIAGFDNHDVTVRGCKLSSACHAIRFGGNNVLIENCRSIERPLGFAFRLPLTEEQKKRGDVSDEKCRHEMVTPFSYYCDHRAELRKPAEKILIRNCRFSQVRELFRVEFDGRHVWCCNRSLRQITFENCSFEEIIRAGMAWGDKNEKLTLTYKNCRIAARKDKAKEPILVAANFDKIRFENTVIEGYEEPTILVATDDVVEIENSTPIAVKKESEEVCFAAHPGGIVPKDPGGKENVARLQAESKKK